jgi:hypothetical protein
MALPAAAALAALLRRCYERMPAEGEAEPSD